MFCYLYMRNGTVYIPTMGIMEKGFYRGIEPVAVVSATNAEALREALAATITRGNPTVPKLRRREWPPPVILKYAGVRTWSAFERRMLAWEIEEKDGAFRIAGNTKRPNGMWLDDPEQTIAIQAGASVEDVVDRMASILHQAARL